VVLSCSGEDGVNASTQGNKCSTSGNLRGEISTTLYHSHFASPVPQWHEQVADPTLIDGILDRLVHNAHRIELHGESMRQSAIYPKMKRKDEICKMFAFPFLPLFRGNLASGSLC
jgi:hypothetical protein